MTRRDLVRYLIRKLEPVRRRYEFVERLGAERNALAETVEHLRVERDEALKRRHILEQRVGGLVSQLEEARGAPNGAKAALTRVRQALDQAQLINDEGARREARLRAEFESELIALGQELETALREILDAKSKGAIPSDTSTWAGRDVGKAQQDLREAHDQIDRLRIEIRHTSIDAARIDGRLADVETALAIETERARILRNELDEAVSALAASNEERASALDAANVRENQIKALMARLQELERRMHNSTGALEDSEIEFRRLEKDLSEARDRVASQQTRLQHAAGLRKHAPLQDDPATQGSEFRDSSVHKQAGNSE